MALEDNIQGIYIPEVLMSTTRGCTIIDPASIETLQLLLLIMSSYHCELV